MPRKSPEIRILRDDVANRIAAGEVVERPASAVKELLENALDADATRVEIEFRRGGRTLLRVADNGCGMTREQALMSLEPHATSKICEPDDLFKISSYGFRGEAVPSIASVSKFTMRTRSEDCADGTEIEVYGGEIKSVKDCGIPRGTEVCVENLFFGVPARRKFLKSDNAEASQISKLCRLYALLLPNVSFSLIEDSRLIFKSDYRMNLRDRISRIFGTDISEKLMELPKTESGGFSVEGMISKAGESFATSRNICIFINSRPVDCRTVFSALKESYSTYIPKGRYSAAFLFITLDPASVDVNVHPTKREVRLRDEFGLRYFLTNTFAELLRKSTYKNLTTSDETQSADFLDTRVNTESQANKKSIPTPAFTPDSPAFTDATKNLRIHTEEKCEIGKSNAVEKKMAESNLNELTPREKLKRDFYDIKCKFGDSPAFIPPPRQRCESKISQSPVKTAQKISRSQVAKSSPIQSWKFLGCVKKKWILFQTDKGITFISISNAKSRVRFEIMYAALKKESRIESQSFLMPINIHFERGDTEYFELAKESFKACGFDIEDFGKNFYRITSAPAWLEMSEAEAFMRDFVEMAKEEGVSLSKGKLTEEIFARLASKSERQTGEDMSESEARALTEELLSLPNYATSPDGNPVMREISDRDVSKFFE